MVCVELVDHHLRPSCPTGTCSPKSHKEFLINRFFFSRLFHQTPPRLKFIHKLIKPVTEGALKKADNIAEGFNLVYKAPMDKYILALSIACAVTTAGLTLLGYQVYTENMSLKDLEQRTTFGEKVVVSTGKYDLVLFIIGLVGFNIMMSIMIRRYPLRIWKNGENYIVVFEGHIPSVRRYFPFLKGQVEPVPARGILPWKDSRFLINGQKAILLDQYFKTPSELHHMINEKYRYY